MTITGYREALKEHVKTDRKVKECELEFNVCVLMINCVVH